MFEISPQKVVHVIYLARELAAGDAELHAFIDALNDDEKAQLTASPGSAAAPSSPRISPRRSPPPWPRRRPPRRTT
jgi:hypothetical protein